MELRDFTTHKIPKPELRETDSGPQIVGYGAVFNKYSRNLGGFVEMIDPGAFTDTLTRAMSNDICSMANHDPKMILGRMSAGNLAVEADGTGVLFRVAPPVKITYAADVVEAVRAGLIPGSSFAFRTLEDDWALTEQGFPKRTLIKVELYELGPVTNPAYPDSTAGLRSRCEMALRSLATLVDDRYERIVEAADANELRSVIASIGHTPEPAEQPVVEGTPSGTDPAQHASPLLDHWRRMYASPLSGS